MGKKKRKNWTKKKTRQERINWAGVGSMDVKELGQLYDLFKTPSVPRAINTPTGRAVVLVGGNSYSVWNWKGHLVLIHEDDQEVAAAYCRETGTWVHWDERTAAGASLNLQQLNFSKGR